MDLANVSHRVIAADFDGTDLVVEVIPLNSPGGKILEGLVEGGVVPRIKMRAIGIYGGSQQIKAFDLVTFDIAGTP